MRVIPLLLLLFPLGLPAKELVICGTMEPPLKFLDADQKPRGLDIDIVTAIFDNGVTRQIAGRRTANTIGALAAGKGSDSNTSGWNHATGWSSRPVVAKA